MLPIPKAATRDGRGDERDERSPGRDQVQKGSRHAAREAATARIATHSRSRPGPPRPGSACVGHRRERLRLRRPPRADGRDRERCDGAEPDDDGADPEGRRHPVDERLVGRVAAVAGEDRGQHGDAEDAAELADRVVGAGGLALLLAPDRREDEVRHRREEQRHADAGEHERHDQGDVGRRRRRDERDPAERDRLQRQPDAEDPLRAHPVGHRAGERGDEHRRERPRQDPQARAERRVALHGLEELRQQEDRAEHPEEHEQRGEVRERERRVAEERHRQHRMRSAQLPGDERADESEPEPEGGEDLGARPAQLVAADQAPDDPEHAGADEADAGQVELAGRPVALGQPGQCERHEQDPDRDVEPEDVLPREALDDGTADDRAERDREPADRAPRAEREPALRAAERRPRGSSASAASRSRRRAPARRGRC